MEEMKVFSSEEFGEVRTITKNGEPWFVASDVAGALGYVSASNAISRHCKGALKQCILSRGGEQETLIIPEPDVYRLIMRSKQKRAEAFQDWVFESVLPAIRKTGEYKIPEKLKQESTQTRNALTDVWKAQGCTGMKHYVNLTLEEYKTLFNDRNKRKKDMTAKEILKLKALEAMEAFKLSQSDGLGYYGCKESIHETGLLIGLVEKKELEAV